MKELTNKELNLVIGGAISGAIISSVIRGVSVILELGRSFGSALRRVEEIARERKVSKIVLGFPKHMNGDIGEKALLCADFKDKLVESLQIEVILVDERWTTKLAQNRLL